MENKEEKIEKTEENKKTGEVKEEKIEAEEKKEEIKTERTEKKIKKSEEKDNKKTEAHIFGRSLEISTKQSMAICKIIKKKSIENAIKFLEEVVKMKKAVPMKGEIPHRKGNIERGRYPITSAKVFIKLLKSLAANASVNGVENPFIKEAYANIAFRPFRKGGRMRGKRTHVYIKAAEHKFKEAEEAKNKKEK